MHGRGRAALSATAIKPTPRDAARLAFKNICSKLLYRQRISIYFYPNVPLRSLIEEMLATMAGQIVNVRFAPTSKLIPGNDIVTAADA